MENNLNPNPFDRNINLDFKFSDHHLDHQEGPLVSMWATKPSYAHPRFPLDHIEGTTAATVYERRVVCV